MRLGSSSSPTVLLVATAAISRRCFAPRLIFPDELPSISAPPDEGSFDGPNPPGATGFWTVFDDLATEDNLGKASRGEPTTSFLSTNMVLRADGQTSRGSDFIRGRWELEKEETRKRLRMTLRAPTLREELRYDGLLLRLSTDGGPLIGGPSEDETDDELRLDKELRVVGRCSRWDVRAADAPRLLKNSTFSMIKIEVDRTQLTPSIKPFSQPLDPEEVRRQQATQREFDASDANELRKLLGDVRSRKQADPDNWRQAFVPDMVPEEESTTTEPDEADEHDGEAAG